MNEIINRRSFATLLMAAGVPARPSGEALYNGIRLPPTWPPRGVTLTGEPQADPPYLTARPDVIPIDIGRQLFVDDFLIDRTTLTRTFHAAEYHPANPVLRSDKPWERQDTGRNSELWGPGVAVSVYSDGVWYEPREHLFKMWYRIGYTLSTALAVSDDGVHWRKALRDVTPGTNIVHPVSRGSSTTWLDLDEPTAGHRYKMVSSTSHMQPQRLFYSPDGVHWTPEVARSIPCGDRTTVFFNPFRKVWVVSIRDYAGDVIGRVRRYFEAPTLEAALHWKEGEPVLWTGADRLDGMRRDLKIPPQLYNLDGVGYESVLLGAFSIWRGQPEDRPKPNEVFLGFSRDGFHWSRPSREPFIPVSEHYGDWNWGNVQSAGGVGLIVGDRLHFYVMGWAGERGKSSQGRGYVGLATLRRDGFASMDANADGGELTTLPLQFGGSRLFVNVEAPKGDLLAEVLDESGRPIPGFTSRTCIPVRGDHTIAPIRWRNGASLQDLASQPVRLRFRLRNARLYSFWVSANESGASRGFVAAGGPGFEHPYDDAGHAAYRAAKTQLRKSQ